MDHPCELHQIQGLGWQETTSLEEPANQTMDSLPRQHDAESSAFDISCPGMALSMWEESVLTGSPEPKSVAWNANRSQPLGFDDSDNTANEQNPDLDAGAYATAQDGVEGFGGLQDCHVALLHSRSEQHTLHDDEKRLPDQHVQAHPPPAHFGGDPGLQHARQYGQHVPQYGQHVPQYESGPTVNSPSATVPDEQLVPRRSAGPTSECPSLTASHEQASTRGGTGRARAGLSTAAFSEQLALRDGRLGQPANCLSSVSTLAAEFDEPRPTVAATYTVLPGQLSSENALGEFALGAHARRSRGLTGPEDADAACAGLRSFDYEVTVVERSQGPRGACAGVESRECSVLSCTAVSSGLPAAQRGARGETEGGLGMKDSSAFALTLRPITVPICADVADAPPPRGEGISLPTPDGTEAEHAIKPDRDLPHAPRPKPEHQHPRGDSRQGSRVSSPTGKGRYTYRSSSPISPQLDIGEVRESLRHVSPQSHKPPQGPREPQSPVLVGPVSVAARARAFNELVKRAAVSKSPDRKAVPITRSRTCVKQSRPSDAEEPSRANSGPRSASCAPSALPPGARYPPSVLAPLRKALQFDNVDSERRSQVPPFHQHKPSSPTISAGSAAALPDQEPHVEATSSLAPAQGAGRMTAPQESVPRFSAGATAGRPPPPASVCPVQATDPGPFQKRHLELRAEGALKPEAGWVAEAAPAQPVTSSAGSALRPASGGAPGDRGPAVGTKRQSEQPLLPSRIPRLSSTGSRSRGTSSEGEGPARDLDEPHVWEPSKLPGRLHEGGYAGTTPGYPVSLAAHPTNKGPVDVTSRRAVSASRVSEAEPFPPPIKETRDEHPKQERLLYNMVVQAGPRTIPVTREEQAAATDTSKLGGSDRLPPPVSLAPLAGEVSGSPHKEGLPPSPTAPHVPPNASHVPQGGVGRRLLTPTRLLYKMVVQASCTSPSKVSGEAHESAFRHPAHGSTSSDAAALPRAAEADVAAGTPAAVACARETEDEQMQVGQGGILLGGSPASAAGEAAVARTHVGNLARHGGPGGAELGKGPMPTRLAQAKWEPSGGLPWALPKSCKSCSPFCAACDLGVACVRMCLERLGVGRASLVNAGIEEAG